MSESNGTVRLHRVLRAPLERVYRAFIDPDAMARWVPPYGFIGKVHEMDARVGGGYRMSFTNFGTGYSHAFGGKYLELTPPTRIRYTDARLRIIPNLSATNLSSLAWHVVPVTAISVLFVVGVSFRTGWFY